MATTDPTTAPGRPFRLLRSMLFVPANNERFLAKAAAGEADGVILDLEDAVPPSRKAAAREAAVAALRDVDWGRMTVAVRINGLDSPHTYRDAIALAEGCPRMDLIVLPMVDGPDDVRFLATLLAQVEQAVGRTTPIGIEGIVETPRGLERIGEIAPADPRLEALSFGAGDYAAAMGMRSRAIGAPDPDYALVARGEGGETRHLAEKWHWPMARVANACHAWGLRPRDTAYADFKDPDGYRDACRRAVALGYVGKSAIHPSQVAIANEVFSPDEREVAWARELVQALERSEREGSAAVAVAGEMIDLANLRLARRILAVAEHIAARDAAR